MPQFIRTAGYKIYFWSNEKDEPIHFHATKGNPDKDDTKFWILPNGAIKLAHNKFFSKNSSSKDGFYSICKSCRNKKIKPASSSVTPKIVKKIYLRRDIAEGREV